jgi:hypothetical protein
MRDWKKSQIYCNGCGRWQREIQHRGCPKGAVSSLTWVDIRNLEMGCNKCDQLWPLEENWLYCSCGHVQRTQYTDAIEIVDEEDQIIARDGDLVYVLTRSGTIVVGYRSYDDISYEA